MEVMRDMAFGHDIVEFGVRGGNSTASWLAGIPKSLFCYDIAVPVDLRLFQEVAGGCGVCFEFTQADTGTLESIPPCDILFIDTLHTGPHLTKELWHARNARKFVVIHDTIAFAVVGEGGEPGLSGAIDEFLLEHPEWRVFKHYENCNGLMILAK